MGRWRQLVLVGLLPSARRMSVKRTLSLDPHIEQLKRLRHREVKLLAWGHPATKCQSWDLNLGALAP